MSSRRLFFALWPDGPAAAELHRLARSIEPSAGRRPAIDDLHVTLCFLGGVADELLSGLEACAGAIQAERCELRFDALEYWARPRILVLLCQSFPQSLESLVGRLQVCARGIGSQPQDRPFRPHLTLLRGLRTRPPGLEAPRLLPAPISLAASRFYLAQSQPLESETASETEATRYRRLRAWDLLAPLRPCV